MRYFKTIISTLAFICCLSNYSKAQYDSSIKTQISEYINYIENLIAKDDNQKSIIRSIAEGSITQEIVTTSKNRHHNKVDTISSRNSGGWGKDTYQNSKGDTVYKIAYHDNILKNYYLSFIFKDNQLVYSKLEYQENGVGQAFYKKEEYYRNGVAVYSVETPIKIDELYKSRINIDLYLKGMEYYKEFLLSK